MNLLKRLSLSQVPAIKDTPTREAVQALVDHSNRILEVARVGVAIVTPGSGGPGGDAGAPSIAYAPTSLSVAGGVLVDAHPSGPLSTVGHFEWYWSLVNTAPTGTTAPSFAFDTAGQETIPLTPPQAAFVWIRAVGLTGLRQAWISLGTYSISSVGTLGVVSFTNTINLFTVTGATVPGGGGGGGGGGGPTGPKLNEFDAASTAQSADNSSGDTTAYGRILCLALQTREPHFKAFIVEMWDSTRTTLVNTNQSTAATWDFGSDTWSQTDTIGFPHLVIGETYSFRVQVLSSASNAVSAFSAWADKTVGDTTAPATTYTPVTTTRDAGGITLHPTIGGLPSPDDTAYYDWFHTINSSPTPAAIASPTKFKDQTTNAAGTALAPFLQIALQPSDTATVWIRSVDTSGNRQAWVSLGTFGITAAAVTGQTCTQSRYVNGSAIQIELDYGFTTPNDALLAGINVYLYNEGGTAKYRRVQMLRPVPINSGFVSYVRVDPNPFGFLGPVTIYFVSVSIAGVESTPISSSPSVVLSTGLDGSYSGPSAVSGQSAVQLGRSISVSWLESFDKNIAQYNVVRAQDGTHNSPGASVVISAATYSAGTITITTATPHGILGGSTIMIFGATGWPGLNGCYSSVNFISTTQISMTKTFVGSVPGYTASSARIWGQIAMTTGVRQFAVVKGAIDPGAPVQENLQFFQDQTFLPSEYVPGNPDRYFYFISCQTADGLRSPWVECAVVELSVDAAATSNWNPLGASLNRLFNTQFLSNTTTTNRVLVDSANPSPADTDGQGTPPTGNQPWYNIVAGNSTAEFVSNGASGTGEVRLPPFSSSSGFCAILEKITSQRFAPGSSLVVSIYLRTSDVTKQNYNFQFAATRFNGNAVVDTLNTQFNASLLSTDYARFDFEFKLSTTNWSAGGIASGNFLQIEIGIISTSASATPSIYMIKGMLNDGRAPANWTPTMDSVDAPGVGVITIALPPPTAVVPPSYSHKDPGVPVWGS